MDSQAEGGEVVCDRISSIPQKAVVIREEGKVIYIPEISGSLELFFDKVVEPIEVAIGEELTSEVANRQTMPTLTGSQQIITGEIFDDGFLLIAVVDDGIYQPQRIPTLDFAAE